MTNKFSKSILSKLDNINDKYKQPLPIQSINNIRKICPMFVLPNDFVFLNSICRCDFFRLFPFYNFENEEGIIGETLELRIECKLPDNYLVLAQDDPGVILMKINSSESSEVILCSYYDFQNICKGKPMEENPTIFPSFADFYEFLLDEEEKMRAEYGVNK